MKPFIDRMYGREGYKIFIDRPRKGFESEVPMMVCAHCNYQVVLNPERKRPRSHCRKCDAYVCDDIACNIKCVHER